MLRSLCVHVCRWSCGCVAASLGSNGASWPRVGGSTDSRASSGFGGASRSYGGGATITKPIHGFGGSSPNGGVPIVYSYPFSPTTIWLEDRCNKVIHRRLKGWGGFLGMLLWEFCFLLLASSRGRVSFPYTIVVVVAGEAKLLILIYLVMLNASDVLCKTLDAILNFFNPKQL